MIGNRYREVIRVCIPLIMSNAAVTVMEFTDRAFLSRYSIDSISAATPAGVTIALFLAVFSGVAGYTGVFIAQYSGSGAHDRVGTVLWQGIYWGILSGIFMIVISFFAGPIFRLGGHPPEIRRLEEIYFRILSTGSGLHVLQTGLGAFFTGLGNTRPVMIVTIIGMIVNIPLDYALINGVWGFPEKGIAGAAWATVISWGLILGIYLLLVFTRDFEKRYRVRSGRAFDPVVFRRILSFGLPASIQFFMDVFAFLFFIFMMGRIGKNELAVTNIVLSINSLAFLPAVGFSQGVSALVGESLGKKRPEEARQRVKSAVHLLMIYICLIDLLYFFAPDFVLSLFISRGEAAEYAGISSMGRILLMIVGVYVFLDSLYILFAGALRGAGDTNYVMWTIGFSAIFVLVLPVYIGIEYFRMGVYAAWGCLTLFIVSMFLLSFLRYKSGKWEDIGFIG